MSEPDVEHTYGIRIEGIGSDTSKSEGLCWYWGNRITKAQLAASDYEWRGGPGSGEGMIRLPEGSDSQVSLWTASLSLSSISPRLHLSDRAGRALMRRVLSPLSYLVADLTDSATTIKFTDALDESFEDTVIYVGDEAILLGSVVAGTPDGETWFGGCSRAHWGTNAQALGLGTRVYDGPPYRAGREITLVRFDHADDSEEVRWFGVLDDAPPTNDDHTTLDIGATEIFTTIKNATVNEGSPDYGPEGNDAFVGGIAAGTPNGTLSPRPPRTRAVSVDAGATHNVALQFGEESLFLGTWIDSKQWYTLSWTVSRFPLLGSSLIDGSDDEATTPIHEVLLVSAELDIVDLENRSTESMRSSTALLEYPFHPIAVWLAMTIDHDDYNVLGDEWNIGAPARWFDLVDIEKTIEKTKHVVIDHWVGGWDGEPVNPWEEFKGWCQTYQLFPIRRPDGRMSVREVSEAGAAEVFGAPTVTARPYRLKDIPSEADGVDEISGMYGALPWDDGSPFRVLIADFTDPDNPVPQHSRRRGILAERSRATIDMPTRSDVSATGGSLQSMAAARHIGAPQLGVRVDDEGFGHGDFVRLAALNTEGDVLRDQTGERIPVDDGAEWVGIVVSIKSDVARDMVDINIHRANWHGKFPRFRSPSAEVASVSSNTVTLTESVFADDDGAEFTVGDPVEAWTNLCARRGGGVREITTINAHEIVLDDASSIEAGDILELAFLSTADGYPETGNPALYDGLAYAFMADAFGTIGPNDLDAHIYGTGSG